MNYYRNKTKNAAIRNNLTHLWEWAKITLFVWFVIMSMIFGSDLLNFLTK